MTLADTLLQLAEKVEAATGPDRELDVAIAEAVGQQPTGFAQAKGKHWLTFPAYTASLDAAMTLVPEGLSYSLHGFGMAPFRAEIFDGLKCAGQANAATPALALTAAALRAQATNGDGR